MCTALSCCSAIWMLRDVLAMTLMGEMACVGDHVPAAADELVLGHLRCETQKPQQHILRTGQDCTWNTQHVPIILVPPVAEGQTLRL